MPRFYNLVRHAMKPDVLGFDGGVVLASAVSRPAIEKRRRTLDRKYGYLRNRLFDPQLYLSSLMPGVARKECGHLVTYPWFTTTPKPFDSDEITRRDWTRDVRKVVTELWEKIPEDAEGIEPLVRSCLAFQQDLGCESVIAPAPLVVDPQSDYSEALLWLTIGLRESKRVAPFAPILAGVAISDRCFATSPRDNALVGVILDQITARDFDGVYLVIESDGEEDYYWRSANTVGAMLRLVDGFKKGGVPRVVVAFAGTAGLMAAAAGADIWSTGWYRSARRLRLREMMEQKGLSWPAYYSHALASEIHPDDLVPLRDAGFLDSVADETEYSAGLLAALRTAKTPPKAAPRSKKEKDEEVERARAWIPDEWKPRQSNIRDSKRHFARVMLRETTALHALAEKDRINRVSTWLAGADALANAIYKKGVRLSPRTGLSHQNTWKSAFADFVTAGR